MISFAISLGVLMLGYLTYSKFIGYRLDLDNHFTSVGSKTDVVDYVTMPNGNAWPFMRPCTWERKTIE